MEMAKSGDLMIAAPLLMEFFKPDGPQTTRHIKQLAEGVLGMQVDPKFIPPPTHAFLFLVKLLKRSLLSKDPLDCEKGVEEMLAVKRSKYAFLDHEKNCSVPGKGPVSIFNVSRGECQSGAAQGQKVNQAMADKVARILHKSCRYGAFRSKGAILGMVKVFGAADKTDLGVGDRDVPERIKFLVSVLRNVHVHKQSLWSASGFDGHQV
jgi:hypothetical protein